MGFFNFLRRALGGKKATPATAARKPIQASLSSRRRERQRRQDEREQGERAKADEAKETEAAGILLGGPAEEDDACTLFMNFGHWLHNGKEFKSSHVTAIQYDGDRAEFVIEYNGGKGLAWFYMYSTIDADLARSMCAAISKGKWVWRNLRQLGTNLGFQKPYVFVSGPSSGRGPKWMQSRLTRKVHGMIPPSGKIPKMKNYEATPEKPKPFQGIRLRRKKRP